MVFISENDADDMIKCLKYYKISGKKVVEKDVTIWCWGFPKTNDEIEKKENDNICEYSGCIMNADECRCIDGYSMKYYINDKYIKDSGNCYGDCCSYIIIDRYDVIFEKIDYDIATIVQDKKEFYFHLDNKYEEYKNYITELIEDDRDVILELVGYNGKNLKYVSKEYKDDQEIVEKSISNNSKCLKYASDRLKNSKDVVKLAICNDDGFNIRYASSNLLNDKELILLALNNTKDGILGYISEIFRCQKDIVKLDLKNDGWDLQYVSDDLKSDKELVLLAVTSNPYSLQFASTILKDDEDIVLMAMKGDIEKNKEENDWGIISNSLQFASIRLQKKFKYKQ